MAYATFPKIQRANTTVGTNYDILSDDATMLAQLQLINPDFPTKSIPMGVDVFLDNADACQIRVNGGEWQDFLADVSYDLGGITRVKSVEISANDVDYTVTVYFE